MKHIAAAWILTLIATSAGAASTPIYRCGPDGREYSQVPCAGGKVIESSDSRSAAQQAEAVKVAARDRQRAAELERERRAQEASVKPAAASGFNARPLPPATVAPTADKGKHHKKRHAKVKRVTVDAAAQKPKAERKRSK